MEIKICKNEKCQETFVLKGKGRPQKYCCVRCRNAQAARDQKRRNKERKDEKSTLCICPLCGETHEVVFNWTGRGIPYKYCPDCKWRL